MAKFALSLLLLVYLMPAFAAGPAKLCHGGGDYPLFDHSGNWQWMDRDCRLHTLADLDHILAYHRAWMSKFLGLMDLQKEMAAHGAFNRPLRADLSGAYLVGADLAGASLIDADLSDADLRVANLANAHLGGADLAGANLVGADLTSADLSGANLANAHLEEANLTGAWLQAHADLTDAQLPRAHLANAILEQADLTHAILVQADLTGADLLGADLTGAHLNSADLTSAILEQADLSNSDQREADLSDTDLTGAKLWYADFEPKAFPPVSSIARSEGLKTLRWYNSFPELAYLGQLEEARKTNELVAGQPTLPNLWIVWLSLYRERMVWQREQSQGTVNSPQPNLRFFLSDVSYGIRHYRKDEGPSHAAAAQNWYPLVDLRNALNRAGYTDAELQVNLAYQRRTQSTLGMMLYDWTCAYGTAPLRPIIMALVLAFLAVPVYWLGFRRRLFRSKLLRVESDGGKNVETLVGDPNGRPKWRGTPSEESHASPTQPKNLPDRIRLLLVQIWSRLRRLIASYRPRLLWEARFLKAIVLFSLFSIINLGFEGLDFSRWVRSLTFREYDLKAHGWLRTVSGAQSLVGLGLLALALLSFFGHRFE